MDTEEYQPVDTLRPQDFVEYRLVRLAEQLERRFSAAVGAGGLSARQFSVLAVLAAEPGITSADLARAVLTRPQSMHALLEQLQARGLVDRGAQRGRGRAAPVRLTAAGRAVLSTSAARVVALDAQTRAGLGEADHRELVRLLDRVEEVVGLAQGESRPSATRR
jgi:DNA-binding MarR family transcriptional regulator